MDDLYARLRPPAPALAPADRAALRRELFGDAATTGRLAVAGTTVRLAGRPPHPRRRLVTVAATALGVLGLSGLLVATRDGAPDGRAAGDTVPPVEATTPPVPPRVLLDAPGWHLADVEDVLGPANSAVLSPDGIVPTEMWAIVSAVGPAESSVSTAPPHFAGSTVVDAGETSVTISRDDRLVVATWTGEDTVFGLTGWGLDDAMVRSIAGSARADSGAVSILEPPAGWRPVDPAVGELFSRWLVYKYDDDSGSEGATARSLTVKPMFGGDAALRRRTSAGVGVERTLGGESIIVQSNEEQLVRISVVRGDWAWEVDVQGVGSVDDALALFAQLRVVDEATWTAALPDGVVATGERPSGVADLLDGVPVPAGFSPAAITGGGTTDRFQLVAQVSGAVACAWLDQWFSARDAGDAPRQQAAADALATSRTWPMLTEIADQGGWSAAVWEWADAVNGGAGIGTGAGKMPPDRDLAASALGCSF